MTDPSSSSTTACRMAKAPSGLITHKPGRSSKGLEAADSMISGVPVYAPGQRKLADVSPISEKSYCASRTGTLA